MAEGQRPFENWGSKSKARYMDLSGTAVSDKAKALIVDLAARIEGATAQRKKKHKASAPKLSDAVAAMLADLLTAAATDPRRKSYRQIRPAAFVGQRIRYHAFTRARLGMVTLGLLEQETGCFMRDDGVFEADPDGDFIGDPASTAEGDGIATRLRATGELFGIAERFEVTPSNIEQHFKRLPPTDVLELRRSKRSYQEDASVGKRMSYVRSNDTRLLEEQVAKLNAFLSEFRFENCPRLGFYRVFNGGDEPGFAWNLGGRLYDHARKESYQLLSEQKRLQTLIDGARVAEIDIRASHLTILYGVTKQRPNWKDDPYQVEGLALPRSVTKRWTTITLGHTRFHDKWPEGTAKKLGLSSKELSRRHPIKDVQKDVLRCHPLLRTYHRSGWSIHRLMFVESTIIIEAMTMLLNMGIPSLPVHDSLVVRETDVRLAQGFIAECFERHVGIAPNLTTAYADGRVSLLKGL